MEDRFGIGGLPEKHFVIESSTIVSLLTILVVHRASPCSFPDVAPNPSGTHMQSCKSEVVPDNADISVRCVSYGVYNASHDG